MALFKETDEENLSEEDLSFLSKLPIRTPGEAFLLSLVMELFDRLDAQPTREKTGALKPLPDVFDPGITSVEDFRIEDASLQGSLTNVVFSFTAPHDPEVDKYEIWGARIVGAIGSNPSEHDEPTKMADATTSPVRVQFNVDADRTVVFWCRTRMKDGRLASLQQSPSVATAATSGFDMSFGDTRVQINATDGFKVTQISTGDFVQIIDGLLTHKDISQDFQVQISSGKLSAEDLSPPTGAAEAQVNPTNFVLENNNNGTFVFVGQAGDGGAITLRHGTGASTSEKARLDADNTLGGWTANSGYLSLFGGGASKTVEAGTDSSGNGQIKIDTNKVIGVRGASVATVSGTADLTYDATERDMLNDLVTAVNAIINRLQASTGHGLIA